MCTLFAYQKLELKAFHLVFRLKKSIIVAKGHSYGTSKHGNAAGKVIEAYI